MDVQLPDGTVIQGIPDGMSKADLTAKLAANGYDTSKLGATPPEDYSNEGRANPTPVVAPKSKADLIHEGLQMPAATKNYNPTDAITGVEKAISDNVKGAGLDKPMGSGPMVPTQDRGYLDTIDQQYKNAGKGAGATKFLTEAAIAALPSAKAGALARSAINEGPGLVGRSLGRAVEAATGGAVAGGILAPGSGETRAGNAAQGAAIGTVAGPLLGGIGDLGQAVKGAVQTGPQAALTRAKAMFDRTLGQGRMDSIESNLNLPRELPMSTAASVGRPELDSLERMSRGAANPVDNARWARLDSQTNQAALAKMQRAVGDDLANLQPRAAEKAATLTEAQQALNTMRLTPDAKQSLGDELLSLKDHPAFENNRSAQQEINNFVGNLQSGERTVGGLAHYETDLANSKLSPPAKAAIWDVVRKHIDANSGGAWSEAYNLRGEADTALKQSEAANNIVNSFQSVFGGARGKTAPTGDAAMGSQRLQNAMNKHGETKVVDGEAQDLLNPDTRQQLDSLVAALRQAESPRAGKGGQVTDNTAWGNMALDRSGNPVPVAHSWMVNAAKVVLRKLGADQAGATQRAADLALRSPAGWSKMLDAAKASNELSASDAAMIARILRGVGPASGAASIGDHNAP